jgi:hypothetical protein
MPGDRENIFGSSDPNSGWSDPIGTFLSLRSAVRILASTEGPRKVRMDNAISALANLSPRYFPKTMREKAERVLNIREKLICDQDSKSISFPFDRLKPKEFDELIQDIFSLYEACVFDLSNEVREIVRVDDE